jgi:hypothetical protein
MDEKIYFSPTPCLHSTVCVWSPEDLLNKNVSYTKITTKGTLKMTFLLKTSETKKFLKIFFEVF